jgi:hypothetical protein
LCTLRRLNTCTFALHLHIGLGKKLPNLGNLFLCRLPRSSSGSLNCFALAAPALLEARFVLAQTRGHFTLGTAHRLVQLNARTLLRLTRFALIGTPCASSFVEFTSKLAECLFVARAILLPRCLRLTSTFGQRQGVLTSELTELRLALGASGLHECVGALLLLAQCASSGSLCTLRLGCRLAQSCFTLSQLLSLRVHTRLLVNQLLRKSRLGIACPRLECSEPVFRGRNLIACT